MSSLLRLFVPLKTQETRPRYTGTSKKAGFVQLYLWKYKKTMAYMGLVEADRGQTLMVQNRQTNEQI